MDKRIIVDGERIDVIAIDVIPHLKMIKNEIFCAKKLSGVWKLKKDNYLKVKKKLTSGIKLKKTMLFIHIYLRENKKLNHDIVSFWEAYKGKEKDDKSKSRLRFYYRHGTGTLGVDEKGIFIAEIKDEYSRSQNH